MTLSAGTQLGPYEILSPIGAGGMGEVYRAKDTRLKRDVAIKVLPERLAKDPEALNRFEREAQAVAALSHSNILAIYDVGTEGETSYVVTELLEGETLRERVRRSAIPWRKAIEIGTAIADGLAAAHAKGIIHRDLKPENIFLTLDGLVKILDFGLARMTPAAGEVSPGKQADTPTMTLDTRPGTVLGTVNYMSPEQISGRATDARTDVFSVGCVLHEMVTGSRAFTGKSIAETTTAILRDEPSPIADSGQVIPLELDREITRCLEKKPQQRIQSARDLAFALRDLLSDSGLSKPTGAYAGPRMRTMFGVPVAVGVVAVVALLLTFNVGGWRELLFGPTATDRIDSLAVLPLKNLSDDPEQEYFADGMTEALIANLGQISGLDRVISHRTVMRYKGTDKSLPEIARELNVDGIVDGSVQRFGDRVLIRVNLIHAPTDRQLWSKSYNSDHRDILTQQNKVARAIAHEIQVKLTPQEQARLAGARLVRPAAHEAYLRGRHWWNKRTGEGLNKGIEFFNLAIDNDPDYAMAYAALADAYVLLGYYDLLPPKEACPKAREAAQKALGIDDTLAEAHASLALIKACFEWDWVGAEREFREAVELNPSYPTAHHWYACCLSFVGRHEEAAAEIERAQELDPLSVIISASVGLLDYYARRYDKAIKQLRSTLELDPDFAVARLRLSWVYERKSMDRQAFEEYRRWLALSGFGVEDLANFRSAYEESGLTGAHQWHLDYLRDESTRRYVSAFEFARLHTLLGETDQAFGSLEKAYEERSSWMTALKVDPAFDHLRDDPRFDDLLRRVGLGAQASSESNPTGGLPE